MKKPIQYAIKGIGIVLFIWIITSIDVSQAKQILMDVSPVAIIKTLALFPVIYIIKSMRWHVLASSAGAKTTPRESIRIYMSGLFLGIATPGRVGEAFKIPALVAQGLKLKDSAFVLVTDRLLDMFILSLLGIWAVGTIVDYETAIFMIMAFAIFVAITVSLRKQILKHAPEIDPRSWTNAVLLTVINWAVYFLQLWILAQGFGLTIKPEIFVAIMTLVGIISALPIAPAGLGTRDAALILFFTSLGISAEKTIAFSFTIFALTIIASSIGAYYWIKYPTSSPHPPSPAT